MICAAMAFLIWFTEPVLIDDGKCHHGIQVHELWYSTRWEMLEMSATLDTLAALPVPVTISVNVDSLWTR